MPLDHAHLRTWELQIFYPDTIETIRELRSLCFVRNPVNRFVSAIFEHFGQYRPEAQLSSRPWTEQQMIARDFAARFEIKQAFIDPRYVHLSPQVWFTHLGDECLVKTPIPLTEGFDAFRAAMMFLELPDCGQAGRGGRERSAEDLLGPDLVDRVRGLYEIDYQFLAQRDHLRPLMLP